MVQSLQQELAHLRDLFQVHGKPLKWNPCGSGEHKGLHAIIKALLKNAANNEESTNVPTSDNGSTGANAQALILFCQLHLQLAPLIIKLLYSIPRTKLIILGSLILGLQNFPKTFKKFLEIPRGHNQFIKAPRKMTFEGRRISKGKKILDVSNVLLNPRLHDEVWMDPFPHLHKMGTRQGWVIRTHGPQNLEVHFGDDLSKWPNCPSNFKSSMEEYINLLKELARKIMQGIALALGGPPETFEGEIAGDTFWVMRIIGYPGLPAEIQFNDVGCEAHTDYGLLTLVNQDDDVHALQVN
ncbi:hypothetical protein HPP92_015812 [Vanilla planifolia]|uniref:Uncharacterized protein n=1 Tax=Vanilla planifolia TaxID=51239 RepID=A0A835QPD1_VANPL|nr:hypothetical protein HPP92_015812 [Vanilla planifolia]